MNKRSQNLLTVMAAVFVVACSSEETPPKEQPTLVLLDQGTDKRDASTTTEPDASDEVSAPEDMDSRADQDPPQPGDMADVRDADMSSEKEVKFFAFQQSDWEQDNPCRGAVMPPVIQGEYQYPTRTEALYKGKATREELSAVANSTAYTVIHRWTFDTELRPDRTGSIVYRNDDKDVRIYIHTIIKPEDIERTSGTITALVDYKPVEATYHFSQDRWENRVFTKQATGTTFPIDTQFSMMEIVLPAELFVEQRVYEISIGQITSRRRVRSAGFSTKIHLLNQGTERLEHPCFEKPLSTSTNTFEYALIREGGSAEVMIFPAYYPAPDEISASRQLPAKPGQEIRVNLSLQSHLLAEKRERTVFLKPLLNGQPLEDEWRVSLSKEGTVGADIDARKTFTLTLPEEPGVYEVSVAAWQDPHLMAINRDGTFNDEISFGGLGDSSNILRFEVKAPDDTTSPDE